MDLSAANSPSIQNQNAISLKRIISSGFSANGLASKAKNDGGVVDALTENLNSVRECDRIFKQRVQKKYTSAKIPSRHLLHAVSLGRYLLPQCALDATGFLSDVYKKGTRAKKFLADDVQGGKSMIEMLGVLAIIAVLSVGGIAGYGKAMRMWNSNIQKEQITQIWHSFIRLKYELKNNLSVENDIMNILNATGDIPAGMRYTNGAVIDKTGNYYSGSFGAHCWQESQNSDKKVCDTQMILFVTLNKTDSSLVPSSADLCENLVYVAKENAQDVDDIQTYLGNSQDDDNPGWRGYHQSEVFNQNTLKTATPLQIKNMCRSCKNHGSCSVSIYFKTS